LIKQLIPVALLSVAAMAANAQGVTTSPGAAYPVNPANPKTAPVAPQQPTTLAMAQSFRDLDKNKDGKLTELELGTPPDRSFMSLDADRDGRVSEKEYAQPVSAPGTAKPGVQKPGMDNPARNKSAPDRTNTNQTDMNNGMK